MPSWKKLIVSGSDASLSSLTATSYGGNISGSASSTGSFGVLKLDKFNGGIGASTNTLYGVDAGSSIDDSVTTETAIGYQALKDNATSGANTAVGSYALWQYNGSTGRNTAVGLKAGWNLTGGYRGTYIGWEAEAGGANNIGEIVIGYAVTGKGSNTAVIGGGNITDIYMSSDVGAKLHTGDVSGSAISTGSFGRVESNTLDVKGNISGVSASFSYVTASKVEVDASTLTIGGTALTKTDADNVKNVSNTNSGDVTLSGTPDYITISNQVITRNQIDLTADVTGTLPVGNGGTGVTSMTNLKNALDDETWTFAEKLTADAGIDIDNINIDGTTIALSSGDLTLDVEGDIILDANGADIKLKDNGTEFGRLSRVSSDLVIKSISNNNDMLFKGVDNTSTITALTLDMSESGDAYFNNDISGSTIRASGDVIAFNSSDERFKDNIQPISEPLWKLSKIGGYEFDWNDKQDVYEGHDVGVIAQEVHKVLPEVVGEKSDGYLGVKYEKIVPLLIESVKELTKKTKKLERELKKLKRK